MKYSSIVIIMLLVLSSCNNPKRSKEDVGNTDSIVLKEIINKTYSKDSSFFKIDTLKSGYTIYMKYKGKFYRVHEKAGGDFLFIYTDSTKSRYAYDKKGKYILKGEERRKYFHLLSGN